MHVCMHELATSRFFCFVSAEEDGDDDDDDDDYIANSDLCQILIYILQSSYSIYFLSIFLLAGWLKESVKT